MFEPKATASHLDSTQMRTVQGQLGHRGGVTERYAEFAPDYQAKATAAIEAFWEKVGGDSSGTVPWAMLSI